MTPERSRRSPLDYEPPSDACIHCHLPLGRRPVVGTVDGTPASFCCYGCVLALQVTRARGEGGVASAILIRLGLAIFFTMNVMMVSMPTYVPYVYGTGTAASDGPLFQILRVLALVFAAPVLGLLGWPILAGALRGLRRGGANTDALIVLGTLAAYVLSAVNTINRSGAVYFDTAAMLLVLVTIGRYLEARAKADAGLAVRTTLAPQPALATRLVGGRRTRVPPETLAPRDVVRVVPGDAFPTDGVVLEGVGGVDEAALTGESAAVVKQPGSPVAGGTCSVDGVFLVRVTARTADSAAARIVALLAAARRERAPAERLADRVAAVMVPAVVAIAVASGTYWTFRVGLDQGVLVALAVLVVACPCGLGIATPVALWTGLVTAARRGVIVRSAPVLERAAAVNEVLFDKTGTLTERTPALTAIEVLPGAPFCERELLARAAALEAGLTHPLARGLAAAVEEQRSRGPGEPGSGGAGEWESGLTRPRSVTEVHVVPGRGVRGLVDGEPITVGSVGFAAAEFGGTATALVGAANVKGPVVLVWRPGQLLGALGFSEAPRRDTAAAIARLRQLGLRVGLLSGDTRGDALVPGIIAPHEAALALLPEDKVAYLRARPDRVIAMVGDGINDAPALAAADLGVAVCSATDLARLTADVAIVSNDLDRVPWLLGYTRRVVRVIRQNLFWAFAYNVGAVAAATAGVLNPLIASLAMLGSSLAVVANARRLRTG